MAKRRIEVATLHQACAKYKSRARIAPVQRPSHLQEACSSTKTSTIMRTLPTTSASLTNEAVCSPCQVATDVFGELKEAVDAFAEKLNAALADKEAQFSSALKEKDDEIGKLRTTLAERDRRDQERSRRIQRKRDEDIERDRQDYENTIRKMAEMEERDKLKMARNKLMLERKFAKLDEDLRLHLRRINLRHVVNQRANEQA